jgi:hypothetical protein
LILGFYFLGSLCYYEFQLIDFKSKASNFVISALPQNLSGSLRLFFIHQLLARRPMESVDQVASAVPPLTISSTSPRASVTVPLEEIDPRVAPDETESVPTALPFWEITAIWLLVGATAQFTSHPGKFG